MASLIYREKCFYSLVFQYQDLNSALALNTWITCLTFGILVFSLGNWDNSSHCKIVIRIRNNVSETCNVVFTMVLHVLVSGEKTVLYLHFGGL